MVGAKINILEHSPERPGDRLNSSPGTKAGKGKNVKNKMQSGILGSFNMASLDNLSDESEEVEDFMTAMERE